MPTDDESFQFNLNATGRLKSPMKYDHKKDSRGSYTLCEKYSDLLIILDNIDISKKESKDLTCYRRLSAYNYQKIKHPLCGDLNEFGFKYFTPKRIIVIQMF